MANEITYKDIIEKDILELLGAKDMPEEQKRNLYTKMLETIQNRVILKITKDLSEEYLSNWESVFKSKDMNKINEFLKSKNIDFDDLMMKEALAYKIEVIELAKPVKKAYEDKTQSQS